MAPASDRFPMLLSLTTTGYGKRSPTADYRETRRGAKGVRTIRTGGRNGAVVAVLPTTDAAELLVTTQGGLTIRMSVAGIRVQSRNTLGVRVIRLDEGDAVVLEPAVDPGEPVPPSPRPEAPPPEADEEDDDAAGGEDGNGAAPPEG